MPTSPQTRAGGVGGTQGWGPAESSDSRKGAGAGWNVLLGAQIPRGQRGKSQPSRGLHSCAKNPVICGSPALCSSPGPLPHCILEPGKFSLLLPHAHSPILDPFSASPGRSKNSWGEGCEERHVGETRAQPEARRPPGRCRETGQNQ